MWKIFKFKKINTADRRRIRAEKKHIRERDKSRHRRKRAQLWRQIKRSLTEFIAHPFAKRKLTAAERVKRNIYKHAQHERKIKWQKWMVRFRQNPWRTVFPPKKHKSPDGGYYAMFHRSRKERLELARLKRKQFRENLKRILTTPDLRQKFGFSYLQSTAYFLLAFIVVYVIYQVITIIVASSYHIPIVWYYYQLQFPLYTYSPLYTRLAMVVIFASGPIVSLLIGFLFLRLYFTGKAASKRFRLFYLWGFVCGINMFFGAYIAGFLTRTEFIYTSEWLFMSSVFAVEEIIFSAIAVVTLIIAGMIITPLFLLSSGSVTLIKPEFRPHFILSEVILPWLTGMVILFLITLPNYYMPLIIKTLTIGFLVFPSLFRYNAQKFENLHRSGVIQHSYFKWSIIIVVIAILFFYRVILSIGLKFS